MIHLFNYNKNENLKIIFNLCLKEIIKLKYIYDN